MKIIAHSDPKYNGERHENDRVDDVIVAVAHCKDKVGMRDLSSCRCMY